MFEPLHDEPDLSEGTHLHVVVRRGRVVAAIDDDRNGRMLTAEEAHDLLGRPPGDLILGRLREVHYWLSELDDDEDDDHDLDEAYRLEGLRTLHGHLSDEEWNIAGRATQLSDWRRDHRFCGRCGGLMELAPGERAMRCPVDGNTEYPKLSPAVIVLVERDDGRALLGRSGRWDTPMYSTLAGFVEPGESLEDTVHREIREEVGVEVTDIRYFGSQPWPFPNSLMLGFTAQWAGGDIVIDGDEIADARWFTHDDLPMIPPRLSIARQLIDGWIARQTP